MTKEISTEVQINLVISKSVDKSNHNRLEKVNHKDRTFI